MFFFKTILSNKVEKYDILDINNNDNKTDDEIINNVNYYNHLGKYICCLIDTSQKYILPRIFETCGSGSLLLSFNSGLEKNFEELGFINGENYIGCCRSSINNKINWILDKTNREKVDLIRKNGQELISKSHTVDIRANMILDTLKNLI